MPEARDDGGPNAASNGFTLIELLIVLALLAMIAALAFPATRGGNDATAVKASASELANLMRLARGAAIRDNTERTLTIDLRARSFWVDGLTNAHAIPQGVKVELVTQQVEQISDRRGRLRFYVDGGATGGSIVLTAGRRVARVELDGFTGHVRVRWGR